MSIEQALFFLIVFVFAFGFFRGEQRSNHSRYGTNRFFQDPYHDYYEQPSSHQADNDDNRGSFLESFTMSLIAVIIVWYLIVG
jgi:hypothetical protein